MTEMLRVYIAAPYTSDPEQNVRVAIGMADMIADLGLAPFVPHLYHFWDRQHPHEYLFWIVQTLHWVEVCDGLIRIPGHSPGADQEVMFAMKLGKPVFYSFQELKDFNTRQMGFKLDDKS